jgi:hypothetical protein
MPIPFMGQAQNRGSLSTETVTAADSPLAHNSVALRMRSDHYQHSADYSV